MTEMPADNDDHAPAPDASLGARVAWPIRHAWWTLQERVLWRAGDVGRALADDARWPAERVSWAARRYLVWPLADLYASRGALGRSSMAATLLIAGGAAAFGGVQIAQDDEGLPPAPRVVAAADPDPVAVIEVPKTIVPVQNPAPEPEPAGPVLQGVPPTFQPPADEGDSGENADETASSDSDAEADEEAPPARTVREPLAVARRFAAAFVSYEIGEAVPAARGVFRETAAPALARALADRPPRQPAAVEVPKAKVLNVVPGPLREEMLPVSVSLLRLGATSELRLDLERTEDGDWVVGDVRG